MSEPSPSKNKRAASVSPERQEANGASSKAPAAGSDVVKGSSNPEQDVSVKRAKLDQENPTIDFQPTKDHQTDQGTAKQQSETNEEPHQSTKPPLAEKDVGITCYIEPSVPAFEAIIKQRFSDFQVFEVPLSGDPSTSNAPSEFHITSLRPPPGELLTELETLEAEEKDSSLRAKRFDEEAERRSNAAKEKIKQEQMQREFEKTWPGDHDTPEAADINRKLEALFGKKTTEAIRDLWMEGREVPKHLIVEEEDEAKNEGTSSSSDRGGRGGRGGRGRGRVGKGRGRDGRSGAKKDPRHVTSEALVSKESRTEAHQLIREIFGGHFATETTEISKPPTTEEEEEAAMNNSAPTPSKEKQQALIIRWSGTGGDSRWATNPTASAKSKDEHPKFIRFLLQKTNRDSHDSLIILAKSLGLHGKSQKDLSVAGTKDRRGVTVQEITFQRGGKTLDEVYKAANGVGKEKDGGSGGRGGRGRGRARGGRGGFGGGEKRSVLDAVRERGERGMRIAHLEYTDKNLGLGDLSGNKFVIALRNVKVENEETVHRAMKVLEQRGFINYYGMQRFGTSFVSTHEIGIPLFKGQFEEACKLLLQPSPEGTGAPDVEEAKKLYAAGKLDKAAYAMPRNRVAERAVLDFLKKAAKDGQKGSDWRGAFQTIPKTLRLMYLHAYQSYIWNRMVSARIERFGSEKAIAGDYVFVDKTLDDAEEAGADELGLEVAAEPDQDEDAASMDVDPTEAAEMEKTEEATDSSVKPKGAAAKVKILTEKEAELTSILDVLMPMPGSEVTFPEGSWLNKLYLDMLAEDGLTPEQVGMSNISEYALRGSYRKMIRRPSDTSYELIRYTNPNIALCQSDEDRILGLDPVPTSDPQGEFLALLVRFTLGTSSYATMALREVLKADTSSSFQKEMTRKSEDQKWKGNGASGGRDVRKEQFRGNSGSGYDRDRGAHVNKVSGSKQRQWGKAAEDQDPASSINGGPADSEIHVSEAATEAFRKAREQMDRDETQM